MIKITETIRDLINNNAGSGAVCVVGTTAMKDGYPQVSPKGSMVVYNNDCLAFWERSGRTTLETINENPRICVYYRHRDKGSALFPAGVLRFYGDVEILPDGPERDRVWSMTPEHERKQDPGRKGRAVIVRLQRVEDLNGKILMQRDQPG